MRVGSRKKCWRRGLEKRPPGAIVAPPPKELRFGVENIRRRYTDEAGHHGNKPCKALSCSDSLIRGCVCVCACLRACKSKCLKNYSP